MLLERKLKTNLEPPRDIYTRDVSKRSLQVCTSLLKHKPPPKPTSVARTIQRPRFIESAPSTVKDIAKTSQLALDQANNILVCEFGPDNA